MEAIKSQSFMATHLVCHFHLGPLKLEIRKILYKEKYNLVELIQEFYFNIEIWDNKLYEYFRSLNLNKGLETEFNKIDMQVNLVLVLRIFFLFAFSFGTEQIARNG